MPLVETPGMYDDDNHDQQPLLTSAADAAAVARAAASTAAAAVTGGAGGRGASGASGNLAMLEGGGGPAGEFIDAPADPDAPQCRICYGTDDDLCGENGRLFRPCRCKGSAQGFR